MPPLVDDTAPVVLIKFPNAVPLTPTVTVQLLLVAIDPPVSDTLPEPATAVAVPPQLLVSPFGVATTSPAGRLSLNATPVSPTVLAAGLVMVNVSEVVPFKERLAAPNALEITGGATGASTVMLKTWVVLSYVKTTVEFGTKTAKGILAPPGVPPCP